MAVDSSTVDIGESLRTNPIKCECGGGMLLRVVRELEYYKPESQLICPNCRLHVYGFDFIYQCPRGKINEHVHGYALCYKCAAKQIADGTDEVSNANANLSLPQSQLSSKGREAITTKTKIKYH